MAEVMRQQVRIAAEKVGIEVNSTIMWPICAMDPFIEACARLDRAEKLLIDAERLARFGDVHPDMDDDGIGWKDWCLDVREFLLDRKRG
jgi:hypothetical protein